MEAEKKARGITPTKKKRKRKGKEKGEGEKGKRRRTLRLRRKPAHLALHPRDADDIAKDVRGEGRDER